MIPESRPRAEPVNHSTIIPVCEESPMLCACGKTIHPAYENGGGVCEDCFAERAEKFHLPGCHSLYYGNPTKEEDHNDDQIITRRSEADRHDRRRATSALWRAISCFAPAQATPRIPSRSCAVTDPNTLSPAAPSKVRGHLAGGGSRERHRQQNIETRRRQFQGDQGGRASEGRSPCRHREGSPHAIAQGG